MAEVQVNGDKPADDGFELYGEFYRWHVTSKGKDLMLIDRFTEMPPQDFFAVLEDDFDRSRAPILLALIATSIRNRHQDWSLERIVRTVMELDLGEDITFIDADVEEAEGPPSSAGEEPAAISPSPSSESSPSPTPQESSSHETLYGIPA